MEAKARKSRRAVFSVVSDALVATQQCGKHISAAMNQHEPTEEAVFSVGAASRLYNEDVRQLEVGLRETAEWELAVARMIEKKWKERN
jgi:hypothetical protein